jgi:hypothetical protein
MISKVRILYGQNDKLVLKKEHEDCVIEGQKISVKLTQEDTLAFRNGTAEVQLRINTPDGNSIPSKIYTVSVDRLLDNEVFV